MKRTTIVLTLLAFMFSVGIGLPPVHAGTSVKVMKNFIKINGVKYRRANAESADIGAIGEKLTPALKVPRFNKEFSWPSRAIDVKKVTTISLSSKQQHEVGGKAAILAGSGGTVSGSVDGASSVSAKYKLVKLEFSDNFAVVDALNKDKKALAKIKALKKNKARLVSAVWVLVQGSEDQTSKIKGTLKANTSKGSGAFSLTQKGKVMFEFKPSTVMAYQIDKFEWDKKREKIQRLKTDQVWR